LQLGVEAREVVCGSGVLVGFFGALDEGVEGGVGVGAEVGVEVLVSGVGGLEFGADV